MTFRVFFCTGVCGLLPPDGRFGTNAAGLPCPGDFFGTGAAWSSLTFPTLFLRCFFGTDLSGAVRLLLHCSRESLWSRHRLGSLIFSTLSPRISLEWALAEGVCSPPYCRRRRIPGLMKLPSYALWQSQWGCSQKPGSIPMAMPDRLRACFPQDIPRADLLCGHKKALPDGKGFFC